VVRIDDMRKEKEKDKRDRIGQREREGRVPGWRVSEQASVTANFSPFSMGISSRDRTLILFVLIVTGIYLHDTTGTWNTASKFRYTLNVNGVRLLGLT